MPLKKHLPILLLLTLYIFVAYRDNLHGALVGRDDVLMIQHVRDHGAFSGFTGELASGLSFYRPFYTLQDWLYYHLFGLSYWAYQAVGLLQHLLVVVLLYWLVYRLSRQPWLAALGALFFAAHPYIYVIVTWVSDAVSLNGIILLLIMLLLISPLAKRKSHLALLVLMLLAPLIRENALIIPAVVACYALIFLPQQRGLILAAALFATGLYFGLRWQAIGAPPTSIPGENWVFWKYYDPQASAALGWKLYAYNIGANAVSTFFPIFKQGGEINSFTLKIMLALMGMAGVYAFFALRWERLRYRWPLLLGTLGLGAAVIGWYFATRFQGVVYAEVVQSLAFGLQGVLSLAILWTVFSWRKYPLRLVILALLLIAASSVIAYPYFRWRSQYQSMVGWVILWSLSLPLLPVLLRRGMVVLMMITIGVNVLVLDSALPIYHRGTTDHLCDTRIETAFALELVELYNLDREAILGCRNEP